MAEAEKTIPSAAHEPADISGRFILGAVGLVLGSLLGIALGVYLAFPSRHLDRTLAAPLPVYPAPRLQLSPREDMARFYRSEMDRLNSAGWVDRARGVARIPIADAMRLVAKEGIKDWPARDWPAPDGSRP